MKAYGIGRPCFDFRQWRSRKPRWPKSRRVHRKNDNGEDDATP